MPLSAEERQWRSLPEAFKACRSGWIQRPLANNATEVFFEEEFDDKYVASLVFETYKAMKISITDAMTSRGTSVDRLNIFLYLVKPGIDVLYDFVTRQLVAKSHPPLTGELELLRFIAMKHMRSSYRVSNELSFQLINYASGSEHFRPMELSRFTAILTCLRGYDPNRTPSNEDETWMEQGNKLCNLDVLERAMFKNSVSSLLNMKNGSVTVDDELISSRASDVETKTLSNHRTGGEGPVVDAISCAQSSVMYGMRLRVKGESQEANVSSLLEGIPRITTPEKHLQVSFDCGYGKMSFVDQVTRRGYSIWTTAAAIGSCHPFIAEQDIESKKKTWASQGVAQAEINNRVGLVKEWIVDNNSMLGAEARIATMGLSGGRKIVATSIRDPFDRKTGTKVMAFFASGPQADDLDNFWVAKKKRMTVSSSFLFSSKRPSQTRRETEELMAAHCEPLTVCQRVADWFLMKSFRLTGTMVGKIMPTPVEEWTDERHHDFLSECLKSWFGRFKASTAMKLGTDNEEATATKFAQEDFVKSFFDVGLLQCKAAPHIGVSPDGVALLQFGEEEAFHACVEIKTRTNEDTTIEKAEAAKRMHGRVSRCTFGDDTFNDCVVSENRKQVMQQAFVTGFNHGVYVVAKVQEGEGSIVQIVVISIPDNDINTHGAKLIEVGTSLIGWLHRPELLEKGYLADNDFPGWVDASQRRILVSRFKLWSAFYKRLRQSNGTMKPSAPLQIFKQGTQYLYNKGKPGVDKNAEQEQRIRLEGKVCFEAKYVLRLIDAVTINAWRAYQAVTVLAPYLVEGRNPPTLKQIRSKLSSYTVQDFRLELATVLLQYATRVESISMQQLGAAQLRARLEAKDTEVRELINSAKAKGTFPVKRNRAVAFNRETGRLPLKKLRVHSSPAMRHKSGRKQERKECALCKASVRSYCTLCEVSLCTNMKIQNMEPCFEVWHSANDCVVAKQAQLATRAAYKQARRVQREERQGIV